MDKNVKARETEMSSGIIRQRRNLMGISIFLPIFLLSGITLDKISFFGNKVSIKNPQIITVSLFVLFIYFVLRYYQYFIEEKHVQAFRERIDKKTKNNISLFLENRIKSKMGNLYEKRFVFMRLPSEYTTSQNFDTAGLPVQLLPSKNPFVRNFLVIIRVFDPRAGSGEPDKKVTSLIKKLKENKTWKQTSRTTNQEELPEMFQTEVEFTWLELKFIKLKTWLHFLIHTTSITNYYLPFIMAYVSSFFIIYWFIRQIY